MLACALGVAGSRRPLTRGHALAWAVLLAVLPVSAAWAAVWQDALASAPGAPGTLVACVVVLTGVEIVAHVGLVVLLARAAGAGLGFRLGYHVLMVSMCANALTPFKAGFPVRVYLYRRLAGIDLATGAALVAVESVLVAGVPCLAAIAGIRLLLPESGLFGPLAVLAILTGVMVAPWMFPHRWLEGRKPGRWTEAGRRLGGFVRRMRQAMVATAWHVFVLGALVVVATLVAQAARLDVILTSLGEGVGLVAAVAAFSISFTLGAVSMLPLGLGVRDASLAWLLADLGVSARSVAIVVVVQRLFAPGLYMLLGGLSTYALGLRGLLRGAAPTDANADHRP